MSEKFWAVAAVNGNGNIMLQRVRIYPFPLKEYAELEASELSAFDNVLYKVF